MQIKIVLLISALILVLTSIFLYQRITLFDGKLHVIFCTVGQGDGMIIRTPNRTTILIDSGPDKSILDCLDKHMPFWERRIHLALLSHPHEDHFVGFFSLLNRYKIDTFATEQLDNPTPAFSSLKQVLSAKHLPMRYLRQGQTLHTSDGVTLLVLGPSDAYLQQTSPNGTIGETKEFGSLVILLTYGKTRLLFTGDSQVIGMNDALNSYFDTVDVLQAPHHGSRFGLDITVLTRLAPRASIISVGKNTYGHPASQTLDLLQAAQTHIFRTDKNGSVELVSDGKTYSIKTEK